MKIEHPFAQQYALDAVGEILGEQGTVLVSRQAKAVLAYMVEEFEKLRLEVEGLRDENAQLRSEKP